MPLIPPTLNPKMEGNNQFAENGDYIESLREVEVFKLGDFVLKSGYKSPIYVDLRELISSPKLNRSTAKQLVERIEALQLDYDYIVGVPYAALPLGTLVSDTTEKPMLLKRKEAKAYGTKKLIEGKYEAGKRALIVEDVVSTGASIIETVYVLRAEGLVVEDVICVLDRGQGGLEKLEKYGIRLHSIVTVDKILDYLVNKQVITPEYRAEVDQAIKFPVLANPPKKVDWSLKARKESLSRNPVNSRILSIMEKKQSNLVVAVDLKTNSEVLNVVDKIKNHVVAVKLHADTITDFSPEFVDKLKKSAEEHDFILFEDRKFADTGNTVELQLNNGSGKNVPIKDWADVVTVHSVAGSASVKALEGILKSADSKTKSVLLIAELSCEGSLTALKDYTSKTVEIAKQNAEIVGGFVCQTRCSDDPSFLYWTPGVNLSAKSDGKGQQWRGIEQAVVEQGNDLIIVGRGITAASDPEAEAAKYAKSGYEALQNRA